VFTLVEGASNRFAIMERVVKLHTLVEVVLNASTLVEGIAIAFSWWRIS